MSVSEIKKQLHLAIDTIENEEFLEALLTIAYSQQPATEAQASEEELKILKEREASYQSGKTKARPWKEIQEEIKKKYGF